MEIDQILQDVDASEKFNFKTIGANTAFAVSQAVCIAGAASCKVPLWKYFQQLINNKAKARNCKFTAKKASIPVMIIPVFKKLGDYVISIVPFGASTTMEAVRYLSETLH